MGTIRKSELSQRTTIIIAVISFLSSTLSYASGQPATVKKEFDTKQEKLAAIST